MKRILFLFTICCLALTGWAQRHYDEILRQVEEHNALLQAARSRAEADQLKAHVGLLLPNPEVEFSLFRGDPADQGTRWDLRVTQSFEMPLVYVRRARLRNLVEQAAQLDYGTTRNTVLYETQLICADLIYYRAIAEVYSRRTEGLLRLRSVYEKRLAQGDCSVLEYNRLQMEVINMQNHEADAILKYDHLFHDLCNLLNTGSYNFQQREYEEGLLPAALDEWFDSVERTYPALRTLQNSVELRQQELQLSRAQWLPEMSVGYASETVTGSAFRGVTVGATLPIWSQQRAVRQASVSLSAAQQELSGRRTELLQELTCLSHRLFTLRNNLNNLRDTYARYNSYELLDKALEAGEMTLEQYLLQVDYYTQQELSIWEHAREYELCWLQLNAVAL